MLLLVLFEDFFYFLTFFATLPYELAAVSARKKSSKSIPAMLKFLKTILEYWFQIGIVISITVIFGCYSWKVHGNDFLSLASGTTIGLFVGFGLLIDEYKFVQEVCSIVGLLFSISLSVHLQLPFEVLLINCVVGSVTGYFSPKWAPYFVGHYLS